VNVAAAFALVFALALSRPTLKGLLLMCIGPVLLAIDALILSIIACYPGADGGADDGGTGFGPITRPGEPTGGIAVDWQKFEADFGVYAEEHERVAVGGRNSP
jgi:hypothetical protein